MDLGWLAARIAVVAALLEPAAIARESLRVVLDETTAPIPGLIEARAVEVAREGVVVLAERQRLVGGPVAVLRSYRADPALPALAYGGLELRVTPTPLAERAVPTSLVRLGDGTAWLGLDSGDRCHLLLIDWRRFRKAGPGSRDLDGLVRTIVLDDLAIGGTRPELVERGLGRRYIATADPAGAGELRIYEPDALARAQRTSEPGVLAARFPCLSRVEQLRWLPDRRLLAVVQRDDDDDDDDDPWRIALVSLDRSTPGKRCHVTQTLEVDAGSRLRGFAWFPDDSALFAETREGRSAVRLGWLHWDGP